jgi:hypothetical protein
MLRERLKQLAAANATPNGLMDLLPASRFPRAETPIGWRPAVAFLFDFVQQQDSLVDAMAAGTQNNYSLAIASDRLRSTRGAVARLAGELRPADLGIEPR